MRDRAKTCPNCGCRQSHENYVCEECGYPENSDPEENLKKEVYEAIDHGKAKGFKRQKPKRPFPKSRRRARITLSTGGVKR
jgi:uncharacterized membrane protein YvbJ